MQIDKSDVCQRNGHVGPCIADNSLAPVIMGGVDAYLMVVEDQIT